MKKALIMNPACIVLGLLISVASHSQDSLSGSSREYPKEQIEELRKQFGVNKFIPEEIELACLTALSYYPELSNTHIVIKFGKPSSTMVSRPRLSSVIKKNDRRHYQVIVRKAGTTKNGLEWNKLSFNSLVGWIGHELAHIVHYDHKSFGGVFLIGVRYAFPGFRYRMERFTDQLAVKHGLGYALFEGTDYAINSSDATKRYKKYLQKFYLSPAEIKKYEELKFFYKVNYQKLRLVDINSIVKGK